MPLTTQQEYDAVRTAIHGLLAGEQVVSVMLDGMQVTYRRDQLESLQAREMELARRLTIRNQRKRTRPDLS